MKLQYRWTKADLEAFCELQANKMYIERHKNVIVGRAYFTICFLILAAIVNTHLIVLSIAFLSLSIISGVKYPVFIKRRWAEQLRKTYSKDTTLYEDRELEITDDLVLARTPAQEIKLKRQAIKSFIQADSTFFLEFSNGMYVVVPKSAFGTASIEQKFVQMFSN